MYILLVTRYLFRLVLVFLHHIGFPEFLLQQPYLLLHLLAVLDQFPVVPFDRIPAPLVGLHDSKKSV